MPTISGPSTSFWRWPGVGGDAPWVAPFSARAKLLRAGRLLAVNALIRLGASASGQLFAFYLADLTVHRTELGAGLVGLLGSCFFLTELLGAPLLGRRADRLGPWRVLAMGPVFGVYSGLAAAVAALSSPVLALSVGILVVARASEGLSAACSVPTTLTLLSRATEGDPPRRTRLMGVFEVTSLVAMIGGYAVAGVAWDRLGRRSFLVLPIIYGLARLSLGSKGRIPRPQASSSPSLVLLLQSLAARRSNLAFGLAWLAVNAVVGVWMQQAPFLLKLAERSHSQALVGGFSGEEIGAVFGVWGLAFLAGIIGWSTLGSRVPRTTAMLVALLGMLGVAWSLWLANHKAGPWALVLAVLCILVESGFTPAALAHLADITAEHDRARGAALGLYSLLLGVGQLTGNVIGVPFAARWQMDGVLMLTGLLAVGAIVMLGWAERIGRISSSGAARSASARG